MGSQSDWATMRRAAETLDELGVGYEARIVSAHRTPDRLAAFAKGAKAAGFKVVIAGAGGAAHLPGMTAAFTPLPVFGVPIESKALSGKDSLLSIVQMPAGVPVGTLAIGQAGAVNAALLAAAVLALNDPALAERLDAWRARADGGGRGVPQRRRSGMILAPGATIGILGSGQLGRMLAMAALKLGLRCHVYAPERDAPAYDAASERTVAAFDDEAALARFADAVDVVTYEFENVPIGCVEFLERRKPVRPGARALAVTQDRLAEKTFLRDLGLATAPFRAVPDAAALAPALAEIGRPAVLKTLRFGYDGKGQAMIREGSDLSALHHGLGGGPMILEGFVAFELRGFGGRRAQPGGRGGRLRPVRERARPPYPRSHPRPGARRRRRSRRRRRRLAAKAIAGARLCRRARRRVVRRPRRGGRRSGCWSTSWRRGSTIPAIGRSKARRPRSSSSTSAPSPAGRSAARRDGGASR